MGKDIELWDWKRIFVGDAPTEFLIEVLVRAFIMYILLLVVVRLMGKRMSGQVSIADMSLMIVLGAIISPGMQSPERAILLAATALAVMYLMHRLVNYLSTKNPKLQHITEGYSSCLVKNGEIQESTLKKLGISKQELFASLRTNKVQNLANVSRVYFEACGAFSIYENEKAKPPVFVYPDKDHSIKEEEHERV